MYKFPLGNSNATLHPEAGFDCIQLPPVCLLDFPAEERPRRLREFCSVMLSTFNYRGVQARGLNLVLDQDGLYYATLELLAAQSANQPLKADTYSFGHIVTLDADLNIIVREDIPTNDNSNWHAPKDIIASIYVAIDGKFSARSGSFLMDPHGERSMSVTLTLPETTTFERNEPGEWPVRSNGSLYGTRQRATEAGRVNWNPETGFAFVPNGAWLRNIRVMGITDPGTESLFSMGLNGIIRTSNTMTKIDGLWTGQVNAVIVEPHVREVVLRDDVAMENMPKVLESQAHLRDRSAAYNTPMAIPVYTPRMARHFVDTAIHAPWHVTTALGEYIAQYIKPGNGNLFNLSQLWAESDDYTIDADAGIGTMLLSVTKPGTDGQDDVVEHFRVDVSNVNWKLDVLAEHDRYRKLHVTTYPLIDNRTANCEHSQLVQPEGLRVNIPLDGTLNLESGSFSLKVDGDIFVQHREGSPEATYVVKLVGWEPRARFIRKEPVRELSDDQKIPAHLVDLGYGAYLSGLVDGQEAMSRASFANSSEKSLLDQRSVVNYARGLAAKHAKAFGEQTTAVRDNPCSVKKEDVQLGDPAQFKSSGTLMMKADSVNIQSTQPLTTTSQGITLTGDPVTIDGTVTLGESTAKPRPIDTIGAVLWFYDIQKSGLLRRFEEWREQTYVNAEKAYVWMLHGQRVVFGNNAEGLANLEVLANTTQGIPAELWPHLVDALSPALTEVIRKSCLQDMGIEHDSAVVVNTIFFTNKVLAHIAPNPVPENTAEV